MSKKVLYTVILVLVGIIIYLLFMPTATPVVEAPVTSESVALPEKETEILENEGETEVSPAAEPVSIDGMFLSLEEAETEFRKSFYYLLLDDGTEIVRIDLRPLLGYSVIDPISKLGVDRGTRVRITGTMADGEFTITTITPLP